MPLSDLSVRQAKAKHKDRTLLDYDGLVLFVPVKGHKAWHLRYRWAGEAKKRSFGTYPEVSLREARTQRDEARALLAKGLNPASERKRRRHALIMEGEHTFMSVYERWRDHRKLSLDDGPRSSMDQMRRTFENDVFPVLTPLTVHEITRPHLLDIIGKVEKRGSLSMAEKLRTWFTQLFTYARVVVPGMKDNPATDLDVVALPLPPVDHTHACIEAVRRNVGERIVHAEFDVDVRVLLQQEQQPRPKHGGDGVVVRRDAHGAGRLVAHGAERAQLQLDLIEARRWRATWQRFLPGSSSSLEQIKAKDLMIKDKVIIITGASSGIGEATARLLASKGAKVVLGARRAEHLERIADEIKRHGGQAVYQMLDVTKQSDNDAVVKLAKDTFGRVDAIFLNAGLMPTSPLSALKTDDWHQMVDVNVKGLLNGVAAVLPEFLAQKSGHVIATSSVAGLKAYPGSAVYGGTKWFVRDFMEVLRIESAMEGTNIRTATIYPAAINTELLATISDKQSLDQMQGLYDTYGISPDRIANVVAFAIDQPDDTTINEFTVGPAKQPW